MSAKAACPAPARPAAPTFESDRLRLLAPSARAVELARMRFLNPKQRLVGEKGALSSGDDEGTVKTALAVLLIMNPAESLTNEEAGLLHGVTASTYGKWLAQGRVLG